MSVCTVRTVVDCDRGRKVIIIEHNCIQPLAFPVDPHLRTSYYIHLLPVARASSRHVVTACVWEPVLTVTGKHRRTERVSLPPSTPNSLYICEVLVQVRIFI